MEAQIKNYYGIIKRILIIILALNWSCALAKIIYGLLTKCASMTADGFHSLSDGASNIIGLVGISFACQPKDYDHPYGHKKYETLFSMAIAVILFAVCFGLVKQGIQRIINPIIPNITIESFIIMLITLTINIFVMNYEYRNGRKFNSDILIADSMHTKADIFTSISVIISLIVIRLGFNIIDPIVTFIIAVFIGYTALQIIKNSSKILCDTAAILDVKRISDIVLGVNGVKTCHKIRTRGRPDDINIDLHVQVNPNMHVDTAHKISYAIEEAIKKEIPQASDVIVHIEPQEKG
ncbi:MAG: cation diffusion facilitator family transporter [Candidatus Omnitrophota bacterium]